MDGKPLEFNGDVTGMINFRGEMLVFTEKSCYRVWEATRWDRFKYWWGKLWNITR